MRVTDCIRTFTSVRTANGGMLPSARFVVFEGKGLLWAGSVVDRMGINPCELGARLILPGW